MQDLISTESSFLPIIKIVFLVGFLIYIVFAFILVRQVDLMTETLELGHEKIIKYISVAHMVFSVLVFLLALILL